MNEKLTELQEKLGITFRDLELLKRALTHRSFLNEAKQEKLENNERFEFLGDAVLELLVTEYLFHKYPSRPEGDLTSFRSATVKTESLAETALFLNLGEYIYMSKGEELTGGRKRPYILANTFEALLGAIYLDQGFEVAKEFVSKFLLQKIERIVELRLDIDAKSKLQEIAQEEFSITPGYELLSDSGPDHNKTFKMGLRLGKFLGAEGEGKSKQEAEQDAARNALKNWDEIVKRYFQ